MALAGAVLSRDRNRRGFSQVPHNQRTRSCSWIPRHPSRSPEGQPNPTLGHPSQAYKYVRGLTEREMEARGLNVMDRKVYKDERQRRKVLRKNTATIQTL